MIRALQGVIVFCFVAYYSWLGFFWSGIGGSFKLDTFGEVLIPPLVSLFLFVLLFILAGKIAKNAVYSIFIAGVLSLCVLAIQFVLPGIFYTDFLTLFNMPTVLGCAFFVYTLQKSPSLAEQGLVRTKIIAILIISAAFSYVLSPFSNYISGQIFLKNIEESHERIDYLYISESPLLSKNEEPIGLILNYSLNPTEDYVFENLSMIGGLGTGNGIMSQDLETDKFNQEHEDDLVVIRSTITPRIEVGDVFRKGITYTVTLYAIPFYVALNTNGSLSFYNFDLTANFTNESLTSYNDTCIYWTYTQKREPPTLPKVYSLQFSYGQPLHTEKIYSANDFYTNLLSSGMEFCPPY